MRSGNIMGAGNIHLAPLFSFHTIIDTDIGLLNLIRNQYLDERVFKKDFFETPFYEQIYNLYHRKEDNLLYLFAKHPEDKETLDGYYHEFLEKCYDEILEMSISTEVFHLFQSCILSPEFKVSILCYDQREIDFIEKEPDFAGAEKILLSSLNQKSKNKYEQFFFKKIEEIEEFRNLIAKTFYISTFGVNLNELEDDLKEYETIYYVIKRKNNISLFDMYDKEKIEEGRKHE